MFVKKYLVIPAMLAIWSTSSLGQAGTAQPLVWNNIDGELKTALETKGDRTRGAAAFEQCQGCHRADASGRVSGAYPRLAGQHATVLMKQITDIRAGRRANPKMEPFIEDHVLTPYDIADIAAYLQGIEISKQVGIGPGTDLARGKQLYDKGCGDCHGALGEGNAEKFYPMVAAQHYKYLLREVRYIRDGDRRNANPDMIKLIASYSLTDMQAVADYMSQLPPPKRR
jgi:cytochrome c553